MEVPNEFRRLVVAFWQGSRREYDAHSDWVKARVQSVDLADRLVAKKFLDELLATASEDELQLAWQSGDPDYWVQPMRPFLTELRDTLDRLQHD